MNHQELRIIKLQKKNFFYRIPLQGYVASQVIFRFDTQNKQKHCGNIQ